MEGAGRCSECLNKRDDIDTRLTKCNTESLDIIEELECEDVHKDNRPEKKRG
ncbi:MAG: hypothetical protein WCH85_06790 [Methanomicrobiales archaeon]